MTPDAVFLKAFVLMIALLGCPELNADSDVVNIPGHETGIWSIEGTDQEQRWIVIHNLAEGKKSGIYHIEVIQRKTGVPAWQIERLLNHMAITEAALKRSIIKPLTRGAVYPEPFDDALAKWTAQNGGKGGDVCHTSVKDCLPE